MQRVTAVNMGTLYCIIQCQKERFIDLRTFSFNMFLLICATIQLIYLLYIDTVLFYGETKVFFNTVSNRGLIFVCIRRHKKHTLTFHYRQK